MVKDRFGSWSCENVSAEGDQRRQAQLSMLSHLRAGIGVVCPVRRERSGGADAHADTQPSRLDRRDEGLHAEDVHEPGEIVGEHVQGHLGGNLRQALHQKVRRTHPHLERTEGMLDCLAAHAHRLRVLIETPLRFLAFSVESRVNRILRASVDRRPER